MRKRLQFYERKQRAFPSILYDLEKQISDTSLRLKVAGGPGRILARKGCTAAPRKRTYNECSNPMYPMFIDASRTAYAHHKHKYALELEEKKRLTKEQNVPDDSRYADVQPDGEAVECR